MKKIIALLSTIVMVFSLTACGDGEKKEEAPQAENETTEEAKEKPTEEAVAETKVEVINERVLKYIDGLGKPAALYLAELKNTGSTTSEMSNVSIDLEDSGGSILSTTDMVSTFPNKINPGESAYVCESLLSFNSDESIENIGTAILHYDFDKTTIEPLSVEITETKLSIEYGFPKVIGRIENKSDKELTFLYVACPIFNESGELLTVAFTIIDSLKPGEKIGFEQLAMFCDTNTDFSNCTFKTIPFINF